jgi:CDP-paratose 2-epimerase
MIVLGGLSTYDVDWVNAMFKYGVMQKADALGIHAFPGTWDSLERRRGRPWRGLNQEIEDARTQLRRNNSQAQVWLTETGYSTFGEGEERRKREKNQIDYFNEIITCAADRVFWHTMVDQKHGTPTDDSLNLEIEADERAFHFGVVNEKGEPKPLFYYWQNLKQQVVVSRE